MAAAPAAGVAAAKGIVVRKGQAKVKDAAAARDARKATAGCGKGCDGCHSQWPLLAREVIMRYIGVGVWKSNCNAQASETRDMARARTKITASQMERGGKDAPRVTHKPADRRSLLRP